MRREQGSGKEQGPQSAKGLCVVAVHPDGAGIGVGIGVGISAGMAARASDAGPPPANACAAGTAALVAQEAPLASLLAIDVANWSSGETLSYVLLLHAHLLWTRVVRPWRSTRRARGRRRG